ncbi:transposase [Candidatus Berkelbacteria bacterium]|nr:transposase [Candidatus Berkelbacteria bacterium]
MLLVSYLYGLSERRAETAVNDTLSMKYFVGLGVDEIVPDHSSLTRFKNRLLTGAGQTAYDNLLRDIIREAGRLGILFGSIQLVDAVHSLANVNLDQDRQRRQSGQPPRDPATRPGANGRFAIEPAKRRCE